MLLKNDTYKKARGGRSRVLRISCQKCGSLICLYQKDGPGSLRRMYLDRISEPQVSLARKDLSCAEGHLIGVKIIYEKENRPAFRMITGTFVKNILEA